MDINAFLLLSGEQQKTYFGSLSETARKDLL